MKLQYSFQYLFLITFLRYLEAWQYRYANSHGLDGEFGLDSNSPIRHSASANSGEMLNYGEWGVRNKRTVGTTAQIQAPEKSSVKATNDIQNPLHSLDNVQSTKPMVEHTKATNDIETESNLTVNNETLLNHPRQDESRLLKHLLMNYDKRVRPVLDAKKNITLNLGITLRHIFDVDEKNQVITTLVSLDQEWFDELLIWDPIEYGNITQIRIPSDEIWLPDIVLYNNAEGFISTYMRSIALIESTGNVFWPCPAKFRSTCQMDIAYFPFDDQACLVKLGSWLHDGFSVDLQTRTSHVDLSSYVPNGEWKLLQRPALKKRDRYYPCCAAPFPQISFLLLIRRKTLYYMYTIIFPCMMISTLTVLVFRLPPDSGEKITLGVTALLAFSVFMLTIAESLPSESIPLIGIYLTFVMAITCISVTMTVIVLNFFYRGPTLKPVPAWAQKRILGKKVLIAASKSEQEQCLKRSANTLNTGEARLQRPGSAPPRASNADGGDIFEFNADASEADLNIITKMMAGKNGDEEKISQILQDWKLLAQKVDYALFWIFLLMTTASSILFIFVLPEYNYHMNNPEDFDG